MIKKINVLKWAFLIILLGNQTIAQNSGDFANTNCVKTGDLIIDAFYGWPYFNGILLNGVFNNGNVKNTNHIGGKVEYMLSEKMGIGGEFTYANASVKYVDPLTGLKFDAGINKIRVVGRFNYHFGTTKNLDPYATAGIGYKATNYYDKGNSNNNTNFNLLPVSMKLGIGFRYYFEDFIGFHAEFGFGGPLILAGITLKL